MSLRPTNYIADTNPFKLAEPPAWWLQRLWTEDDSLVVIPSRVEAIHLIAQRRPLGAHADRDVAIMSPDEMMLRWHGLVLVTRLLSLTGAWNWHSSPQIFMELAARAPWKNQGWEACARRADEADAIAAAQRKQHRIDDIIRPRIRAARRAYEYRRGARIHNVGLSPKPPAIPAGSVGEAGG